MSKGTQFTIFQALAEIEVEAGPRPNSGSLGVKRSPGWTAIQAGTVDELRCTKCREIKPANEFGDRVCRTSGRILKIRQCEPCRRETVRDSVTKGRRANPKRVRGDNLWRFYRIREDDFDAMKESQGDRCRICGIREDEVAVKGRGGRPRADGTKKTPEAFHVDHCHVTGVVRGLLCPRCNHLLGHAREDPAILREAAEYLEEHFRNVSNWAERDEVS